MVAPFMGAWIETDTADKYIKLERVAPFMGAWIETSLTTPNESLNKCRTLHGCVD